jgi:O-antigen/teichoic acid export membrane protein
MQRIRTVMRSFVKSAFLRQNAIFFVGSLLVGFVNYVYYPVLGHMLPPDAYGEVQAIVALFLQLTILLTVLTQVTVNVVTNYQDEARKQRVVFELERLAFMLSIGIVLVGAAFSWQLKQFFQFESVWPFIVLLLVFVASVPLAFRSAYLRAHQKFGLTSVTSLISAACRVICSAILVIIGWKATGAIGGLLAAQLIAFSYAAYEAHKLGFRRPAGVRYLSVPSFKLVAPELRYALFVLAGTMAVTLLSSVDVFVVKHYFDPQVAGEYAGVSTVARTIFFVTSPIALVLLPAVRIHKPTTENRQLLLKSLALTLAVGGPAVLVCSLAERTIIAAMMGQSYLPYAHLLPVLSLAMLFIAVANVIISYYIALRKYQISSIVLFSIAGAMLLMWMHHNSVSDIAMNILYGGVGTVGIFVMWRGYSQLSTVNRTGAKGAN